MKEHNPILLDFVEYKVRVTHKGKIVELKGIYSQGELKKMTGSGVRQLFKKGQAIWTHLFIISTTELKGEEQIPAPISGVLNQFTDIFAEPTTFPPRRNHDHQMPLTTYAILVSIRPYKYNYFAKK